MYDLVSIMWIVIGGLLEPVWLIALKKSDSFKNKKWAILTVLAMYASPMVMGMALDEVPVGVAYAIWTGLGAIGAIASGVLLFKDQVTPRILAFVMLIMVGAIGLAVTGGS